MAAKQRWFAADSCWLFNRTTQQSFAGQSALFAEVTLHSKLLRPRIGLYVQSRPQSASVHKKKGWHALQQGTTLQPGHTRRQSNSPALYVRPDRTVNTNIALDNSPSFPSLARFADALSTSDTTQPAYLARPSTQNSWASPGKQNSQQGNSANSGAAASKPVQQYSAALSPAKASQEEPRSKLSSGMAMSDSELTNITSLLSTHPWAEPGLARVSLPCMQNHCS